MCCSQERESMSRRKQYEVVEQSFKKVREIFIRIRRRFNRRKKAELSARGLS